MDGQTETVRNMLGWTDEQTHGQRDRLTDRKTGTQTDKQTDRQTHTD